MNRQYFPALDGLRFISFLLVFLLHIPKSGVPAIDYFLKSGGIGVIFFFVLSGFLITYILLSEKQRTGTISLRNFFARRILRIWPLFYLAILFAYALPLLTRTFNVPVEKIGYEPSILVSLLFGENYKMMFTNSFPDGAPLRVMWTICVEEHFYLIWGLSMYFTNIKNIPHLIFICVLIPQIARPVYEMLDIQHLDLFTNLDYFAFGAIPAYLLVIRHKSLNVLYSASPHLKNIFLSFVIGCVFVIPNLDLSHNNSFLPFLWAILFSLTIFLKICRSNIKSEHFYWISKLGLYTYGLYLSHTVVILLIVKLFQYLSVSSWYLMTMLSLFVSLLFSMISYHFFEIRFLNLKKHFQKK